MAAQKVSLTMREIQTHITTTPWTKNFRHLLPISKQVLKILKRPHGEFRDVVPVEKRIKWWNIVPGDQVRIRGDSSNMLREVHSIGRLSNRIWVRREAARENDDQSPNADRDPKAYHYSQCQLFLGNYEFPSPVPGESSKVLPVFAQRLGTSRPRFQLGSDRYEWKRFATKTTPTVPHLSGQKVEIPWPGYSEPPKFVTEKDAGEEVVSRVTYKPPPFSALVEDPLPALPTQRQILRTLVNPTLRANVSEQYPIEVFLSKELSNPHSRAKKQARWQQSLEYRKTLLKEYMQIELQERAGRTKREARADAVWKWREKLAAERADGRAQRAVSSGLRARLDKKRIQKAKKAKKQRQRLTNLVLEQEDNQFSPPAASASA